MKRSSIFSASLLSVFSLLYISLPAQATAVRSFIASSGMDSNPCSRTQPCRTFNAALAQTSPNGEVIALDTAGYGSMSINKSVIVLAPNGIYADLIAASGDGIDINAGPSDTVTLKGLSITTSTGVDGIKVTSVGSLYVEKCVINGFGNRGINFLSPGRLFVTDTTVRNQINEAGVYIQPATGTVTASLDHCRFEANKNGVTMEGNGDASISNCLISENSNAGFLFDTGAKASISHCTVTSNPGDISVTYGIHMSGTNTEVTVSDTDLFNGDDAFRLEGGAKGSGHNVTISNCTAGVSMNIGEFSADNFYIRHAVTAMSAPNFGSTLRVSNSTITDCINGLSQSGGGVIESMGNNMVRNNTTNIDGTVTPISGV